MEERLSSHCESLSRGIAFTRAADAKAAPVLALQVAVLGALAARFENLFLAPSVELRSFDEAVLWAVLIAYALCMIATVSVAALVYLPKHPRAGESLIYFEDIAAMLGELFARRAKTMSPDTIEEQLRSQIHSVSRIASLKMRRVRLSF